MSLFLHSWNCECKYCKNIKTPNKKKKDRKSTMTKRGLSPTKK